MVDDLTEDMANNDFSERIPVPVPVPVPLSVPEPEPDCWLHPDVEVRVSDIEGRGLFARAAIPAGTVVARAGGVLVTDAGLRAAFEAAAADPAHPYIDTYTVDEDLHLILPPRRPNGYGNHGCDPNLWWTGPFEQ